MPKCLEWFNFVLLSTNVLSDGTSIVMAQFMQEALDKTLRWGKENGLSFNPLKMTTVLLYEV
jgi:hypothetical protein